MIGQDERKRYHDQPDRNPVQTLGGEVGNGRITHHVLLSLQAIGCQLEGPGDDQRWRESERKHDHHEADAPIRYPERRKKCAGNFGNQPSSSQLGYGHPENVASFELSV